MSHAMTYEDTPKLSKPTKDGIKVIDYMPTRRIIGHLMYRHRVGLLTICNIAWVSWELWDKVGRLFF